MKMMWMLAFALLPLLALAYVGWHVWLLLPLKWVGKAVILVLMASSFGLLFASIFRATDSLPMPLATGVYEVGTSSLIILLYLFLIFLALDFGRLLHLLPRTCLYCNGKMCLGIALFLFVVFLYGNLNYHHKHREQLSCTSEKVTRPVKLVMMSDLHLGYHNRRKELSRWIDLINAEKPDLVLMAGDIIDGSMRPLKEEEMYRELLRLEAPIYACLGNHEYFSGEPEAQKFYQEAGIHLLRDTAIVMEDLCVIGRDDRTNRHRNSLKNIMKSADLSKFCILLDHQPYHLEQAEREGVDFQFSGHTHHGQVWPISWLTDKMYECAFGSYQRGSTNYYVSSGIGIWGGKFRIRTRSEYLVLTIEPAG